MKPQAHCYEIHIEEELAGSCQEWFSDVEVSRGEAGTVLRCLLPDQTALFGVLARIRDLNLTLISVLRTEINVK